MRLTPLLFAAALGASPLLTSCAQKEVIEPAAVYLYEEPTHLRNEISCGAVTGQFDRIEIDVDGSLTLIEKGEQASLDECPVVYYVIAPRPRPELTAEEEEYLSSLTLVSAAREANFSDVVHKLNELSAAGDIYMENDGLSRYFDTKSVSAKDFAAQDYGDYTKNQLFAVRVRFLEGSDDCIYVHEGAAISSIELYERAYAALENFVDEEGGADAIRSNRAVFDSIVFAIQADAATPWRCVLGADFHAKVAGWPFIRFEVMEHEEEQGSL